MASRRNTICNKLSVGIGKCNVICEEGSRPRLDLMFECIAVHVDNARKDEKPRCIENLCLSFGTTCLANTDMTDARTLQGKIALAPVCGSAFDMNQNRAALDKKLHDDSPHREK